MSEAADRRRTFIANSLLAATTIGLYTIIQTCVFDFEEGKHETTAPATKNAAVPAPQPANETAFVMLPLSPL